jgi:SOS-response transcriptional repressor LexA
MTFDPLCFGASWEATAGWLIGVICLTQIIVNCLTQIYMCDTQTMIRNNEEIGVRLREAREAAGFKTAKDAAQSMGVPYGTYSLHETGARGIARAVELYARRLHVSVDWLLRGIGPGPRNKKAAAVGIPLLSWVSAGAMSRDDVGDEALGVLDIGHLPDGDWIALRVEGDSMDRISPPESVILVNRKDRRLVANACYVVSDISGNATYKRYRPNPPRFEPVSTNPVHEPIYPDNEVPVVGRVRRTILDM